MEGTAETLCGQHRLPFPRCQQRPPPGALRQPRRPGSSPCPGACSHRVDLGLGRSPASPLRIFSPVQSHALSPFGNLFQTSEGSIYFQLVCDQSLYDAFSSENGAPVKAQE